mgnify:CR=1 FL=1
MAHQWARCQMARVKEALTRVRENRVRRRAVLTT